jgi:hypothetical protein
VERIDVAFLFGDRTWSIMVEWEVEVVCASIRVKVFLKDYIAKGYPIYPGSGALGWESFWYQEVTASLIHKRRQYFSFLQEACSHIEPFATRVVLMMVRFAPLWSPPYLSLSFFEIT